MFEIKQTGSFFCDNFAASRKPDKQKKGREYCRKREEEKIKGDA